MGGVMLRFCGDCQLASNGWSPDERLKSCMNAHHISEKHNNLPSFWKNNANEEAKRICKYLVKYILIVWIICYTDEGMLRRFSCDCFDENASLTLYMVCINNSAEFINFSIPWVPLWFNIGRNLLDASYVFHSCYRRSKVAFLLPDPAQAELDLGDNHFDASFQIQACWSWTRAPTPPPLPTALVATAPKSQVSFDTPPVSDMKHFTLSYERKMNDCVKTSVVVSKLFRFSFYEYHSLLIMLSHRVWGQMASCNYKL